MPPNPRESVIRLAETSMTPDLALLEAVKHGDREAAEDALARGADVDAVNDGWTPLFWAAQEGHAEIVALLLEAGANVNSEDPGGFTPLNQAVGLSHWRVAEQLIQKGADLNHRCHSNSGSTVLHTAAAYGYADCIRLLLRYGADPHALDCDGQTPYDRVLSCHETEAAALLRSDHVT